MTKRKFAVASALFLVLIGLVAGCRQEDEVMSVTEVWQNAAALNGERIRVRGQADFRLSPYHPLQVGGCKISEDESASYIAGALVLFDGSTQEPEHTLAISESSLQCEGNSCRIECKPFAPSAAAAWGAPEKITAFEFVGTLIVDFRGSEKILMLQDIDLQLSQRLIDGAWEPIPVEDVMYLFP